jgi:hypothetical protein
MANEEAGFPGSSFYFYLPLESPDLKKPGHIVIFSVIFRIVLLFYGLPGSFWAVMQAVFLFNRIIFLYCPAKATTVLLNL